MSKYRWLDEGHTFIEITREDGSTHSTSQASDPDLWSLLEHVEVAEYVPPPPPSLEEVRVGALLVVDKSYSELLRVVTKPWKSPIYQMKLRAAELVLNDSVSDLIYREAHLRNMSMRDVAEEIIATSSRADQLLEEIEIRMLETKEVVKEATSSDGIHSEVESLRDWIRDLCTRIDHQTETRK